MTGLPRIGIRLPQYGADWAELRAIAEALDASAVDAVWVNDHFQPPGRLKADPAFDAITALSAVAACTHRVRLGVAVLSAGYRAPQIAAKQLGALDAIAGGRLIAGLGAGSDRGEHRAFGIPFGSPAERTAAVRTTLAVWDAMWTQPDGATVPGVIDGAPNRPLVARPPVWVAAHGPALLRYAGRHADGIVAAWSDPAEIAARAAVARRAAAAAQRPAPAVALYTFCLVAPDADGLHEIVAEQARRLGTTPAALVRWLRSTGLVGTRGEVAAALAAHARAGATDVILALPERVPPEAYAAVASLAGPVSPPVAHGVATDANLVALLVGRHRQAGRGGHPAVVDPGGTWTFDDLWNAARGAAGGLTAAGVRRGDRVAIALRDGRPWVAAVLGTAWCGAVAIPVDPLSPADRIAAVLGDCEPRTVVAEPGLDAGGWPVLPADRLAGRPGPPCAAVHPEDLAYMIYSSGSTGRPKGVMHSHRDLAAGIETYAREVLTLGPGDACHSAAKLSTSLGFGNGFVRVLGRGATMVTNPHRPNPRSVCDLVAAHGVTVLTAVPTFWAQFAEYLHRHPDPGALAGLRLCVSSGDGLPPAVAAAVADVVDAPLLEGLGCSECSNIVISTRAGDPDPGGLGRAVGGVEVDLRDPEGVPVPDGTPGRLWIRSPSNTSGYWRRSAETRALVAGEWLRMGDVLVRSGGRYRHVGRVDDLFKVDARWVSPPEVEHCLLEDPRVHEAAVGGVPGKDGRLRVVAWVVADADAAGLAGDLRRLVAHRLAPHAAPREVIVMDSLPRLPSGKLDRRALRERPRAGG